MSIAYTVTHAKQKLNPVNCLLVVSLTSSYKVSKGTGRYVNVSGSGTAKTQVLGVLKRLSTGRCSPNSFSAYQETTTGHGPIKG